MSHQIDVLKEYIKGQLIDNQHSPAQEVLEIDGIVCVLIGETTLGIQIVPVNIGLKKEEEKTPPAKRKKTPPAKRKKTPPKGKKNKTTPLKSEKDK